MVVTLGQHYNVREKPTIIVYTYINHHAGPPNKTKQKTKRRSLIVILVSLYNGELLTDIIVLTRCDYIGEPF